MRDSNDSNEAYVYRSDIEEVIAGTQTAYLPAALFDTGIIAEIGHRAAILFMYLYRIGNNYDNDATISVDIQVIYQLAGLSENTAIAAVKKLVRHRLVSWERTGDDDKVINDTFIRLNAAREWVFDAKTRKK